MVCGEQQLLKVILLKKSFFNQETRCHQKLKAKTLFSGFVFGLPFIPSLTYEI